MFSLGRALFFVGLILVSNLGYAGEDRVRSCLTEHIYEAIDLNSQRAPHYETLSQGRSAGISRLLIKMERRLLILAPFADTWAAFYQLAGIPMTCDYFVSMSLTPPFKAENRDGPSDLIFFRPVNVDMLQFTLNKILAKKDYEELLRYSDEQIHLLEQEPRFNCMVRHILESIRRIAYFVPIHEEQAQRKLRISTLFYVNTMLRSHIDLLKESSAIDKLAAPLQAEGLPIVCQDVPSVPLP